MASPYYVNSGAAGTNAGTSWTNAYTSFASAVTAANASGDVILVHKTHIETLAADTTYTFLNNVNILCVDKDAADAPATQDGTNYYFGAAATSYAITLAGAYKVYMYGIALAIKGTTSKSMSIGNTDGQHIEMEQCKLWLTTTHATPSIFLNAITNVNNSLILKNCTFKFGSTSHEITAGCGIVEMYGCSVDATGSAPATLFQGSARVPVVKMEGCDWSFITGTLVGDQVANYAKFTFSNCKLGTGVVVMASQTVTNRGSADVYVFDCDDGDEHFRFGYYNSFGEVTADTAIYANAGALYDGTNNVSWKIVTTANCSFYTPFVTPWIEKYWSATSAISPYFEICRSGSSTAYNDNEVWAEFAAKVTASSTRTTIYDDRMAINGSAAAQTSSSLGASDWTGENATSWFGKIGSASLTPAELGMLKGRVCVGVASQTIYADPTIRT